MRDIVLLGGGGHCRSCIDVIEECGGYRIVCILDRAQKVGGDILGHRLLNEDEEMGRLVGQGTEFLVTVGSIGHPSTRIRLFEMLRQASAAIALVVSPHAYVSRGANIGTGTIVMHRAFVNTGARVGVNCILNSASLVEHDSVVGDHCHISTGTIVNGGCEVGNRVFIGSNTVLRNGVRICDDAVIGAGSVVTKDVTIPGTWFGNPARHQDSSMAGSENGAHSG